MYHSETEKEWKHTEYGRFYEFFYLAWQPLMKSEIVFDSKEKPFSKDKFIYNQETTNSN